MIAYLKLMSTNLQEIDKCANQLAKKYKLSLINLPSKQVNFDFRKSPCGRGYSTYEKWDVKIYKKTLILKSLKNIDNVYKDITPHVSAEIKLKY